MRIYLLTVLTELTRNLFTIKYLKSHSPTVSEFKSVYDALDKPTLKVCVLFHFPSPTSSFIPQIFEALSRQKKAEAVFA